LASPLAADPSERTLLKRQERYYGPLLLWWEEGFGHKLGTAAGFGDVVHPDEAYIAAGEWWSWCGDPVPRCCSA